jgi:hypothetical protein
MHLPAEIIERILLDEVDFEGKKLVRSLSTHYYNATEVTDTRAVLSHEIGVSVSELMKCYPGSFVSIANSFIVDADADLIADAISDVLFSDHYRFEVGFHYDSQDSTSFFELCDTGKRYVLHAAMSFARRAHTRCIGSTRCFEPITVHANVATDLLIEMIFYDQSTFWQEAFVLFIEGADMMFTQ